MNKRQKKKRLKKLGLIKITITIISESDKPNRNMRVYEFTVDI